VLNVRAGTVASSSSAPPTFTAHTHSWLTHIIIEYHKQTVPTLNHSSLLLQCHYMVCIIFQLLFYAHAGTVASSPSAPCQPTKTPRLATNELRTYHPLLAARRRCGPIIFCPLSAFKCPALHWNIAHITSLTLSVHTQAPWSNHFQPSVSLQVPSLTLEHSSHHFTAVFCAHAGAVASSSSAHCQPSPLPARTTSCVPRQQLPMSISPCLFGGCLCTLEPCIGCINGR
jgi:hypothetical protein